MAPMRNGARGVGLVLVGILGCGDDGGGSTGSGSDGTGAAGTSTSEATAPPTTAGPGDMSSTTGESTGMSDPSAASTATGDETGPPMPVDCGAFTPGDDFNVCTATYLGGPGADVAGGVDIAADGTVVVGGAFPGHDFGQTATPLGAGEGAVLRLSPDGAQILSVTRLGGAVTEVAVAPGGEIAAAGDFGGGLLYPAASAARWSGELAHARRISVGSDGTIAALHGKDVAVFDLDGAALGAFAVSGTAINDVAVDGASASVFVTGYRQSDQGACQQYKSTFIRSHGYDGAARWTNYDWNGDDVDDTEDCADSTGFGVAIGRDGKLYYAAKSDGGNTVHRKLPRDLNEDAPNVANDPYNTPYGLKGANAVGYYARFDPASGDHLGGQFLVSRKANGDEDPAAAEANAAPPDQISAPAGGTMVIVGSAAYLPAPHDGRSVRGVKVGAYTAYEPYVLIVAPDFSQRLAWTAFTATGPGGSRGVAVGPDSAAILFAQSGESLSKGPLITVDAVQPEPAGGDGEAWHAVFPTP